MLEAVNWCSRLCHAARQHGQAGPCTMQQARVGSNKVQTLTDVLTLLHCAALSSRAANTLFAACASPQPVRGGGPNHCRHTDTGLRRSNRGLQEQASSIARQHVRVLPARRSAAKRDWPPTPPDLLIFVLLLLSWICLSTVVICVLKLRLFAGQVVVNADKLLHVPQHCRHVCARQVFVLHQCRTGTGEELAIRTRAGPACSICCNTGCAG